MPAPSLSPQPHSTPRSVHLLKRGLVSEDGALSTYSIKVFAGWDFGLTHPPAAIWKHNSIRYELKVRPGTAGAEWGEGRGAGVWTSVYRVLL